MVGRERVQQRTTASRLIGLLIAAVVAVVGCAKEEEEPPAAPEKAGQQAKDAEDRQLEPAETGFAALTEQQRTQAKELYTQHCLGCHGENGDGQGAAARYVFPKPRNFRDGRFRLVSTKNGVPTIADLETVLQRGMPGSSMPPWPQLTQQEHKLLAEQVMEFRREGIREREKALAAELGTPVDEEQIEEIVTELTTPGQTIAVPELDEPTEEAIARGKELYVSKGCAQCHGQEGKGDGQQKMVDSQGLPNLPRDFTAGIFKGDPSPESIYRRTQAGMPGSAMPATRELTPEQIADMVHFVLSLSDEATRAATVLNREQIEVRLVDNVGPVLTGQDGGLKPALQVVPQDLDDAVWNDTPAVSLRLMPLWWRNDFPNYLDVQAIHDGTTIAFRLSWPDDNANMHSTRSEAFEDAVAVGLYPETPEPFLGMGDPQTPVDVWMWDADRQTGWAGIEDDNPNLAVDVYPFSETAVETAEFDRPGTKRAEQPDISLPARATGNQIVPAPGKSAGTSLQTGGPGTVTFRPPVSQLAQAQGRHADGRWTVVFKRSLATKDPADGVSMAPGQRVSVLFAVWDGSKRDRDGQKLVTIWQDLVLEEE